ncbi:MAG: hypothetical protein AAFY07_06835 [Pseudomonadota bacterium]
MVAVPNKRSIPEIRDRLRELAEIHGIPELNDLADETFRKQPHKRAPRKSTKLTPAMAAGIRRYKKANPDSHQQDIAELFGVNHGRVSEALNQAI